MDEKTDKKSTAKTPTIVWKAVEPRHYARAQEKKASSKAAYTAYVVRLVQSFEGAELTQLTQAQEAAIVTAFEKEFAPDKPQAAEAPTVGTQVKEAE